MRYRRPLRGSADQGEPGGILKVSMAPTFGITHLMPLLPGFLARYPRVRAEWHFENRQVDLVAEGYDAAIGGGFELAPGMVSRPPAPAHIVAVASPNYMRRHTQPAVPTDLATFDGIAMRSTRAGRIRQWMMRDVSGTEIEAPLKETFVVNDPAAMREPAAVLGLGVTMIAVPDVLRELESGKLVRLLPRWYAPTSSRSSSAPDSLNGLQAASVENSRRTNAASASGLLRDGSILHRSNKPSRRDLAIFAWRAHVRMDRSAPHLCWSF